MRRTIVLLLIVAALIIPAEDNLSSFLKRIEQLNSFYNTFDPSTLKISILDAINLSKEKDVIAVYLDLVNNSPMWVVLTTKNRITIDPITGKIFSSQQFTYRATPYTVSLKDAISLAFVSIGKGIFFAYLDDQNTWIVGSKEQIASVSTKTPAVLSTQKREQKPGSPGGGNR